MVTFVWLLVRHEPYVLYILATTTQAVICSMLFLRIGSRFRHLSFQS